MKVFCKSCYILTLFLGIAALIIGMSAQACEMKKQFNTQRTGSIEIVKNHASSWDDAKNSSLLNFTNVKLIRKHPSIVGK